MDNKLIESALQLTGKKMDDISEYVYNKFEYCYELDFSIEKFCYYLLSPSFIEKYTKINHRDFIYTSQDIGFAIHEFQRGDENILIELLSKIGNV